MKYIFAIFVVSHILLVAQEKKELIVGPFNSPQEVTVSCMSCHEEIAEQIMSTRHWKWEGNEFEKNGKTMKLGKRNLINNFCIGISSNEPRCTSCHIGYGWKDDSFDFSNPENIDCLICHADTKFYSKSPTGAGMPDANVDLVIAARSVRMPKRDNCGICHFDGGGGAGVNHGDLDNSLYFPSADLDIHMGGFNFSCVKCHRTEDHQISGASHGSMAEGSNRIYCTDCHDEEVHKKSILNKHIASIACETCHIPAFARELPTKVWWDWSTAGQNRKVDIDEFGKETYDNKKGDFVWEKNVVPTYVWYDGTRDYYLLGGTVNPDEIVKLNGVNGTIENKDAKITPFKVMRGKQPYDTVNKYLIVPNLFGNKGYWNTFDWNQSAEIGMKSVNLNFSGKLDFIETEMYWPINHMVAPADKALTCSGCHGRSENKRLDWEKLGYPKNPMISKGRVENNFFK